MVKCDADGTVGLVIPPQGQVFRRQQAPVVYDITPVAYVAKPEYVMTRTGLFEGNARVVHVPRERAVDIDTLLDFKIAECLLSQAADRCRNGMFAARPHQSVACRRRPHMNRKIIYVCFGRLTDKIARDWYIDYLIEKGVSVEYWDIVSLVREEHSEQGEQNPVYLRVFRTFGEVQRSAAPAGESRRVVCHVDQLTSLGSRAFFACFPNTIAECCISRGERCRTIPFTNGANWPRGLPPLTAARRRSPTDQRSIALAKLKLVKPFDIAFVAGDAMMPGDGYDARRWCPSTISITTTT